MSDDLQASDLLARETIESMRDAVLSINRKGAIIMLNPAAERLLGIKAEEVLGHSFAEIFIDRSDLEGLNDCVLEAIYDPATPHTAEIQITADDRSVLHWVVRTNLLAGEAGEPIGVVAAIADVSERVRLLQENLDEVRTRQLFGRFFLYALGVMSIGTIVNNLIARSIVDVDVYAPAFTWGYLVVQFVPALVIIRLMGLTRKDLGLSTDGLGRSLREGALASFLFAALVAAIALTLHHSMRCRAGQDNSSSGRPLAISFTALCKSSSRAGFCRPPFSASSTTAKASNPSCSPPRCSACFICISDSPP
jgi:PAS domain S-box-containing protein